MTMTTTNEKLTLQIAAKALHMSVRTIQRYLDKGLLTKVKEDGKVYVYADEIRGLKNKLTTTNKLSDDTKKKSPGQATVDLLYLEGLLIQVGQLKEKQQLLLTYENDIRQKNDTLLAKERELLEQKAMIEQKNKELIEAEKLLQEKDKVMEKAGAEIQRLRNEAKKAEELQAEIARLKKPWYKRIFKND
jgi:hypothetical protein